MPTATGSLLDCSTEVSRLLLEQKSQSRLLRPRRPSTAEFGKDNQIAKCRAQDSNAQQEDDLPLRQNAITAEKNKRWDNILGRISHVPPIFKRVFDPIRGAVKIR